MPTQLSNHHGRYLLKNIELKFIKPLARHIPSYIGTQHLTYMTIVWSIGVIACGYLYKTSNFYILGVSLLIFFQYMTDILDGEVGRRRNTGLVQWGYYVDHFLDYIFMSSLFFCYILIVPDNLNIIFVIYFILTAFMINSFLLTAITGRFTISYFGLSPAELRLILIVINTLLFFSGNWFLTKLLTALAAFLFVAIVYTVYTTQKTIWKIDLKKN